MVLEELQITYEMVISLPTVYRRRQRYAKEAVGRGLQVMIAGAGLAAHLPGVIAAQTPLPVIGVPLLSGALNGLDALYAIVQMPKGVPVATVGIDNARNAGILAAQILGVQDPKIREGILAFKERLAQEARDRNAKLQKIGHKSYLNDTL